MRTYFCYDLIIFQRLTNKYSIIAFDATYPAIIPSAYTIQTDGERVSVLWNKNLPEPTQIYSIRYGDRETTEQVIPEITEIIGMSRIIALISLIFILGFVAGLSFQRHVSLKTTLHAVPASLLNPDEQTLLLLLGKHINIGQKQIGKELNWSKSKVSGILANLEYKKIITKKKLGRSYTVMLVKRIEFDS